MTPGKGRDKCRRRQRGDGIAIFHMLELLQEALNYGPSSGITLVLADCKLPVHLENKSLRNFSCTSLYQIKPLARNTFPRSPELQTRIFLIEDSLIKHVPYLGKQMLSVRKRRGIVGSWQSRQGLCDLPLTSMFPGGLVIPTRGQMIRLW